MSNYIYAYTHSGNARKWKRSTGQKGEFWIKVGQTVKPGITRVKEQVNTAFPDLDGVDILFHSELAERPDGTPFSDHDVHKLLASQHGGRGETLLDTQPQATLWLDGFALGSPPQKLRLIEGTYKLEARLSPSQRLSATLRVPIDTSLTLRFVDPPKLRSRPKIIVGSILLATGAALLATGVGALTDAAQRPHPDDGEARPPPGLIAGPILLVGGAASTVAGGLVLGLRSR